MRVKVGVRARVRVRGSPPHLVAGEVGVDHLPLLLLVHLVAGEVGVDPTTTATTTVVHLVAGEVGIDPLLLLPQ